ncbi:hypothetical protein [uncultured Alcanivorax sp.]|jgi:hypothetical protein|uniref:hypothetical protein n=1 Tax=uncultured Alcanivorax sp. TaxID=191215 RepID=UPI0025D6C5FF|nr:hypothetical protein [uncultured Alcanivorax sp.]
MIPSEAIYAEYRRRLESITTANGYSSDAGEEIYEGWLAQALIMDEQQPLPFIAMQPGEDRRANKSSGGRLVREVTHHIIVAEKAEAGVALKLQRHLDDLINALADRNNMEQLGGNAIDSEVLDAEYNIPEDSYPVAWVALTVTAKYQMTLEPKT